MKIKSNVKILCLTSKSLILYINGPNGPNGPGRPILLNGPGQVEQSQPVRTSSLKATSDQLWAEEIMLVS